MQSTQTRLQKTKVAPKMTGRALIVAEKSKQAQGKDRPATAPGTGAQERQMLIARAAYFRAEKRGFAPGGELQDWIEAEAEVLRLTGGG